MDPAPGFKQARDRGCAFLLSHQGIRGEFPRSRPALDDYYNKKYRAMALRIGDNLIRLQCRQGYWSGVGQQTPNFDSTAERVVWMDEIAQVSGG